MITESPRASRVAIVPACQRLRDMVSSVLADAGSSVRSRIKVVQDVTRIRVQPMRSVVVLADVTMVPRLTLPPRLRGHAKFVLFHSGRPSESLCHAVLSLDIRSRGRLLVAESEDEDHRLAERAFVQRLLAGMASDDGEPHIASAYVDDGVLTVRSSDFDALAIPLETLGRRLGGTDEDWHGFDIEPLGRFMSWPDRAIDMRWSHLKAIIHPMSAIEGQQRSRAFNRRYGGAIRDLRQASGILQSGVAGLSPRNLRRIEHGEIRATSSALGALARAHGMELAAYLDALASRAAEHR